MQEFALESETCEMKCNPAHMFQTKSIESWFLDLKVNN